MQPKENSFFFHTLQEGRPLQVKTTDTKFTETTQYLRPQPDDHIPKGLQLLKKSASLLHGCYCYVICSFEGVVRSSYFKAKSVCALLKADTVQ